MQPLRSRCDIALITVTNEEREAVVKTFKMTYVQDPRREYYTTTINGLSIVMYQSTNVGNLHSAILTSYIINVHKPQIIIKVGTCGTRKDLPQIKVKSVIVASQVVYLGIEKVKPGKILVEPLSSSCSERLLRIAKICKSKPKWKKLVKIGEIVSSERLLSDGSSDIVKRTLSQCPSGIAFEMDSEGILKSVHESGMVETEVAIVAGVSDYIDQLQGDKTRHRFNRVAAKNASELVLDMINLLPSKTTTFGKTMEYVTIGSILTLAGGFTVKTLREKWMDLAVGFIIGLSVHLWH